MIQDGTGAKIEERHMRTTMFETVRLMSNVFSEVRGVPDLGEQQT